MGGLFEGDVDGAVGGGSAAGRDQFVSVANDGSCDCDASVACAVVDAFGEEKFNVAGRGHSGGFEKSGGATVGGGAFFDEAAAGGWNYWIAGGNCTAASR